MTSQAQKVFSNPSQPEKEPQPRLENSRRSGKMYLQDVLDMLVYDGLYDKGNWEKHKESVIDKTKSLSNNLPQETTVLSPGVHLRLAQSASL